MKRPIHLAGAAAVAVLAWSAAARAQPVPAGPPPAEPPVAPPPTQPEPPPPEPPVPPPPADDPKLAKRIDALEAENRALREESELLREDLAATDQRVDSLLPLAARLGGYIDVGFFAVGGDGSGIRQDFGNTYFPEFAGKVPGVWVYMGDPLSTAINSRGDPAETAESRAIAFDPVNSRGQSSFILNALHVRFFTGIGESLLVSTAFDLVPRSRDASDPDGTFAGDYLDLKLANVEYRPPIEAVSLSLWAGKFDSVVGREYRIQEADDRTTVTPSLLCRYVCGHPIGLKARVGLAADDAVTVTAAVTNGSHFQESFPFADETDSNQFKTVAGRASLRLPGAPVEVGGSGAWGAQDQQGSQDLHQWHLGADLQASLGDFQLTGEYVQGEANGLTDPDSEAECDLVPCLYYKAAYGLASYRLSNEIIPYARVDWRNADHHGGADFTYLSRLVRGTGGLRLEFGTHVIVKAEYTVNREIGGIPQFRNDVFASALVVKY